PGRGGRRAPRTHRPQRPVQAPALPGVQRVRRARMSPVHTTAGAMSYQRELDAARAAADRAGAVILDLYARFEAIADAPASITTAADRESQEVILRHLSTDFPGDAFRAEEQIGRASCRERV